MAGYDTAGTLTSTLVSQADNTFGIPTFWVRYFSPSPTASVINSSQSNAISESRAAWSSTGHYIGCISSPGHPSASQSQGTADAQTMASALHTYAVDVSTVRLPSNGQLYCWTDVEPGQNLGLGYWTGWANYIDGYVWPGTSSLPLYPCLYCNPCDSGANCSTIQNGSAPFCFAIWSFQPQTCSGTVGNPPTFNATKCSSSCSTGYTGTPTQLWQFRIQTLTGCSTSINVDQDEGGGINYNNFCFNITANP